ncbi:MAG: hypothetical protein ACRD30_05145, partial [Bryobacteraceae bacterium]
AGTQPVELCHLHGGGKTQIAGWETSRPAAETPVKSGETPAAPGTSAARAPRSIPIAPAPAQQPPPKPHKGFFGRLKDIFK